MKNNIVGLYPGSKLIVILSLILSSFVVNTTKFNIFILMVFLIISFLATIFLDYIRAVLKMMLILGIFMFIMIAITTDGTHLVFKILNFEVHAEGIMRALLLITRISVIAGGLLLFMRITNSSELSLVLHNMGFNTLGIFIVKSTINMIPEMKNRLNTIMEAQASRGVDFSGRFLTRLKKILPAILPLILSSFYDMEEKTLVLEARGVSNKNTQERLFYKKKTFKDKLIYGMMLMYLLAILTWRFNHA